MLSSILSLDHVTVIAHRGGSKLRPENTLLAFDHAVALGVDAIECDVHLSRDRQPVVIHDAALDRTTDALGPVSARTADELARIDAGCRFDEGGGAPYRGETGVPRLIDLLTRYPTMPTIIEIKGDDASVVPRVLAVIEEAGARARVLIGGFSSRVLDDVRRQAPDIPTGAGRQEVQSALRRSFFRLAPRPTGYAVFQVPHRFRGRQVLTRAFVRAARRGGVPMHAWIVDEPADLRRLREWGVTGMTTDRPDVALTVVRRP